MFNTISLARILNGKHPYKENATKEDYIRELQEEKKEKKVKQKGMSDLDIFVFLLILVIMTIMIRANSEKLDEIIENQKSLVVTPTPQKDVE